MPTRGIVVSKTRGIVVSKTRLGHVNMKTAVDAIFVGKERKFNRRFEQLVSHHLVEPTACTPASGWEKGQVENQVGVLLELTLPPRADCARYDSLRAARTGTDGASHNRGERPWSALRSST